MVSYTKTHGHTAGVHPLIKLFFLPIVDDSLLSMPSFGQPSYTTPSIQTLYSDATDVDYSYHYIENESEYLKFELIVLAEGSSNNVTCADSSDC